VIPCKFGSKQCIHKHFQDLLVLIQHERRHLITILHCIHMMQCHSQQIIVLKVKGDFQWQWSELLQWQQQLRRPSMIRIRLSLLLGLLHPWFSSRLNQWGYRFQDRLALSCEKLVDIWIHSISLPHIWSWLRICCDQLWNSFLWHWFHWFQHLFVCIAQIWIRILPWFRIWVRILRCVGRSYFRGQRVLGCELSICCDGIQRMQRLCKWVTL